MCPWCGFPGDDRRGASKTVEEDRSALDFMEGVNVRGIVGKNPGPAALRNYGNNSPNIEVVDGVTRCAKCHGSSFSTQKVGYRWGSGAIGALALGPIGAMAGGAGANRLMRVCNACGTSTLM